MGRAVVLLVVTAALAACSVFGPPAVHLTRADIAQRAFVDRNTLELKQLLGRFEGLAISGPDVGFQIQAQRLQLEWTVRATPEAGWPLSLSIAISGRPELNATRTGIDLAEARIEQIRLPSVPFLDLGAPQMSQDDSLGRMPLLAFRPDELNRAGVIYEAIALSIGPFGMRVDLAPK